MDTPIFYPNSSMMTLYLAFGGTLSLVTFIAYGVDKFKAKRGSQRISEQRLLLLSFVGGAVGALLAMLLFRHKTRHKKFTICVPLFVVVHLLLGYMMWL